MLLHAMGGPPTLLVASATSATALTPWRGYPPASRTYETQEEPMNTPWQIRRRVIARSDGERGWDAAYQCLLPGAMDHHAGTCPGPSHLPEESPGSRPVCPCLDHPATTNTDECATAGPSSRPCGDPARWASG